MTESIETRLEYLSNLPMNYRVYYMQGVQDALEELAKLDDYQIEDQLRQYTPRALELAAALKAQAERNIRNLRDEE